jgi:16S rRNA G966 N2-methylase RsmD
LVHGHDLQSAGGSPASLRPGLWLDLYSGTGSVGIEAMSRGCSEVFPKLMLKHQSRTAKYPNASFLDQLILLFQIAKQYLLG